MHLGIRRRFLVFIGVVLVAAVSIIGAVSETGTTPAVHVFQFWNGGFYELSHPLSTTITTAALLEAELKAQNPDHPNLELEVAVLERPDADQYSFACYPAGSALLDDLYPYFPSCDTTSNELSWGSRDVILIRVQGVNDPGCQAPPESVCQRRQLAPGCASGGCVELEWAGTDRPFATYDIDGGFYRGVYHQSGLTWVSLPVNPGPYTDDQLVDALLGPPEGWNDYDGVSRLYATAPPVTSYWTGNFGGGATPEPGHGVLVSSEFPLAARPLVPLEGATVSGTVYDDVDLNGSFGGPDTPVPYRLIHLVQQPSGVSYAVTRTDAAGAYAFDAVVPDTYAVDVSPGSAETWTPASGSLPVSPSAGTDVLTGNDLGRRAVHDLRVGLYENLPEPLRAPCSTSASPDNRMTLCVRYENTGNFVEDQTQIALELPPAAQATLLSTSVGECSRTPAPPAPLVSSTEVTWSVASPFEPGDACTVCATVQIEGPLGDILTTTAAIYLDAAQTVDGSPETANTDSLSVTDDCAVDTSDLQVTPPGCGSRGYVARGTPLTYRVRFQNDSSTPVARVQVTDILDGSLNQATLEIVASSHGLTGFDVLPDRRAVFTFDGIDLPSSSSDPEGSGGQVLFRVEPRAGVSARTKIPNRASVALDSADPLLTKQVATTVADHPLSSGAPGPEACNGIDDDCDGIVDNTTCGIGECARTGTCPGGVDDCVPGTPQAEICDELDNNCDGISDNLPAPAGSSIVTAIDITAFQWTPLAGADGYDVVRGDVGTLKSGADFTPSVGACLADDVANTSLSDTDVPAVGASFWYLNRGTNCSVPGTYGSSKRDGEIAVAPLSCP